jgi:hypothetical protein
MQAAGSSETWVPIYPLKDLIFQDILMQYEYESTQRNKNQQRRLMELRVKLFTSDFSLQYNHGIIYERTKLHERKANKACNTEVNMSNKIMSPY